MWDVGAHGWGWVGIGAVHMLLFWALIILAIVVLVKYLSRNSSGYDRPQRTPLDILKERYARGEIDKQEFEEKKRDLTG